MRKYKAGAMAVLTLLLTSCGSSDAPIENATPGSGGENIFLSILPAGSNGNSAGGLGTPVPGTPTLSYPKNFRDQLDMYGNLAYAQVGLKAETCKPPKDIAAHQKQSDQACNYYKRANLTLDPSEVVSSRTMVAPNGKSVTLQRDGWGVPYISGDDRASAQYGLGFAAAQDRLWLFDVLRRAGRGRASEYLGPSDTTYELDLEFGAPSGYAESELDDMVTRAVSKLGELGPMFLNDSEMFVAGMNAYIAYLQGPGLAELPPEYATLALAVPPNFPPKPFTVNDIVTSAVLIQSALGRGGGGEATNLELLQKLAPDFGAGSTSIPKAACEMWRDLRHANEADASYTISKRFATQSPASVNESCPQTLPAGAAIWDAGSFVGLEFMKHAPTLGLPIVKLPGGSDILGPLSALSKLQLRKGATAKTSQVRPPLRLPAEKKMLASADPNRSLSLTLNRFGLPLTTSNWIGVNASETKSGHPIAVMGPQTSYYNPQLLWEAAIVSHGGTPYDLAARGITTVNLPYIVIGHGTDFAWSPTSAGSDFTDTRVSKLCNTNGTPATRADADNDGFPDSDGYLYKDQCVRLYRRLDEWTATPTLASIALGGPPNAEAVKRRILRTHYGPVVGTATVNGEPVVVSTQRSTFLSDVDTAAPFALLTTTGKKMTQTRFKQLFNSMTSTFNWLYLDSKDLAFIQSGLYPQRHPAQHPELPVWGDGRFEWVADQNLPEDFFTLYGGDARNGGKPFPPRAVPVAQGDALDGYFEWQGYLPLSAHIQETNPAAGYMANWNNSGAPGWWAADSNGTYGPTHRVENLKLRLAAFKASGRKHDIATMIEVAGDAAYTDLRGLDVMPLLLQLMRQGTLSADQEAAADLMQQWLDNGSAQWISNSSGLGALRRDRNADGVYDQRAAVVLMDAWYPRLIAAMLPQMVAVEASGASLLQARLDAPRAQGSAFQEGWFQHMKRLLQTTLGVPGHPHYRALKCAGSDDPASCRTAVLTALDQALVDLGGPGNQASWDGSQLPNAKHQSGAIVEDYDAVEATSFSFIPVPPIHWINRPTFQQVVEIPQPE